MPLEIKVKVVKIGNSFRMTIPKDIVSSLKLKAGDTLAIGLDDSRMIVRKIVVPG